MQEAQVEKKQASLLDKPLAAFLRLDWWTLAYLAIIAVAVGTRLWNLGPRAYSHDESIHAWESWKLVTGQSYRHNPTYHGPFLYHFTALIFMLFGHGDYTGRLSPALFGIALVILPIFLRKWLGRKGTLMATLLMTISPVIMNRSRFLRHDPYVAVWAFVMLVGILKYLDERRARYLYVVAAGLCLSIASKEVAFIYVFIFGTFLALFFYRRLFEREIVGGAKTLLYIALAVGGTGTLAWTVLSALARRTPQEGLAAAQAPSLLVLAIPVGLALVMAVVAGFRQWWSRRLRGLDVRTWPSFDLIVLIGTLVLPLASPFVVKQLGWDPIDYSQNGIMRSGAVFLVVFSISVAIGLWWNWRRWLVCVGIFYAIFIPLFTTMLTNGNGLGTGLMGSLGYWLVQQEVKRGGQPWFYYLILMPMYEFLPMLFSFLGTVFFLWRSLVRVVRARPEDEAGAAEEETATERSVPLVPLLIYWSLTSFLLYSWAGEKMPWLAMHLAIPLILLAGWFAGKLLETDWSALKGKDAVLVVVLLPLAVFALVMAVTSTPFRGTSLEQLNQTMRWLSSLIVFVLAFVPLYTYARRMGRSHFARLATLSLGLILAVLTMRFAWMATFEHGDSPVEMMVYAQGAPDCSQVMSEIDDLSRRLVGENELKVAYDEAVSWPFVWYLRDYKNAYFFGKQPGGPLDAEVVLVGTGNEAGVKPHLGTRYLRREYRLVWWPNQEYMSLTPQKLWSQLRDPVERKKIWDILFYRKWDTPLTQWPHVNRFAMYVRRDVAALLWDFGPEIATAEVVLPEDEYVEKYTRVDSLRIIGAAGSDAGQLNHPKGIALDSDGNVYVADANNHRVEVFTREGKFLRQWGGQGNLSGQFQEPWSVAVDPDAGAVYVADTWNHRIQKFDLEGQFVTSWGSFGDTGGQAAGSGHSLYGPRDVALDGDGNLWVADTGNKRVLKFDPDGGLLGQWGGAGDAPGQFLEPVGIAFDEQGSVYVADTWNQRIQKFTPDFTPIAQWPVVGWESTSVVNKPYLATDRAGSVYATDPENYRLLKFNAEGELLKVWGQYGSDASSLNLPTGVGVSKAGEVFVADSDNNRLVVFPPVD